jgi:hypothetical protein
MLGRVLGLLALALGLAGVAACGAGAYGVWRVQTRLERANDRVFDAVDQGLAAVQDRIPAVQERVRQAQLTTDDLSAALRNWGMREARERIVAKLEVDVRAEQLTGQLLAVEARVDASTMAVRDVRRVLEVGRDLGADVDPSSTDDLLEQLAALDGSLGEARRSVDEVRALASPDRETVEERLIRIARVLARILATFVDINARLDRCMVRLTELRAEADRLRARTSRTILLGAVAGYGLLAWVAAGQAALARWGWGRLRGSRPAAPAPTVP